jgi:hypothetical protein
MVLVLSDGKFRGRVGIEPTQDSARLPRNDFEDRTPHQRCPIPICDFSSFHQTPDEFFINQEEVIR